MRRKALILAAIAAVLATPAGVSAQAAPSPAATLTITESIPGVADQTYQVSCDWYPSAEAQALVVHGSYHVILPGNEGWLLCN